MGNFSILTSLTLNSAGFNSALDNANKKVKKFGGDTTSAFGGVKGAALLLTSSVAGLYGVMEAGKAVIASSDSLSDSFEGTLGGVKNAVTYLMTSIATADFSNFINGISDAAQAGKDYISTLDEIGMKINALAIIESKNRKRIAELQILSKDPSKSLKERIGYQKEILSLKKEEADYNLEIANQEYNAEFINASKLTGGKLKPNQILNMLQDPLINQQMIKDANEYNKKLAEYQALNYDVVTQYGTTIPKTEAQRQSIKRLGEEIKNTSPAIKKYAEQLSVFGGRLNEEQYKKLTDVVVKKGEADAKYAEDTKKNQIGLAKLNKGIIDLDEKESKKSIQIQKEKLGAYDELIKKVGDYKKLIEDTIASGNIVSQEVLDSYQLELNKLEKVNKELERYYRNKENIEGIQSKVLPEITFSGMPAMMNRYKENESDAEKYKANRIAEINKELEKQQQLANLASNAINSLGDAFIQMAETGQASFKGLVMSTLDGIRQIVNGLLVQAIMGQTAANSKFGLPGLALAAVGIVGVEAIFASLPKFSEGGVVGGNSFNGDKILARVNTDELLLNGRQQANLLYNMSKTRNSNSIGDGAKVEFVIRGDKLVGVLNNYSKKRSNTR